MKFKLGCYSKPKRPNYYAKTVPFQSCGCAVVPGCHSNDVRSLWRVASTKHSASPLNQVSRKNQFLTRREPLKRATPRIKLHLPLIKLIKKDQVCYSAVT